MEAKTINDMSPDELAAIIERFIRPLAPSVDDQTGLDTLDVLSRLKVLAQHAPRSLWDDFGHNWEAKGCPECGSAHIAEYQTICYTQYGRVNADEGHCDWYDGESGEYVGGDNYACLDCGHEAL